MKRFLLLSLSAFYAIGVLGQNLSHSDSIHALQLLEKNKVKIGLTDKELSDAVISSAYKVTSTGMMMVYFQQTYKGLPVFNKMLVLAFMEDSMVSIAGKFVPDIEKATAGYSVTPIVSAKEAVGLAFDDQELSRPVLGAGTVSDNGKQVSYGKPSGVTEEITATLFWFPVEKDNEISVRLAWQVQVAPAGTDDIWHIRIDAITGKLIDKFNIVIFEDFRSHHPVENTTTHLDIFAKFKEDLSHSNETQSQAVGPEAVAGASYLVIPYPVEAPSFGPAAVRVNPWLAAPGNATSLGWHSTGTNDYLISRGNNVYATEDTLGANQNTGLPATSTIGPDPLSFQFTPNYVGDPSRSPIMQQFCITNLFYWNNITHDITYQYGFDEVSGNFQNNNQGRGGNGNDHVMALAQSGASGHIGNNANFTTGPDGGTARMRMYLFDSVAYSMLVVNSPGSIAGPYSSVESAFSINNKLAAVGPVTGQVVYYNDDAAGTTHYACNAPNNSVSGKIALIDRGFGGAICTATVPFTQKVLNAQNAGAIAVIMVNNVPGPLVIMSGTDNSITIPAVMISQSDGAIFAAQLANNLNVTLSGVQTSILDGDLDNGIVVHEYSHGISNRLTGGPNTVSCLQNAERGSEGWSDYIALMLTTNWATAAVSGGTALRGVGTYVIGQPTTSRGIRNYPYSTNIALSPLTYAHMGITGTPWLFSNGSEVHNIGEIWSAALWEMTWAIIQQENNINPDLYNFSMANNGGNSIALKLVMEGMRLQPCNPGFLDARNAILTADRNLYGGRHQCAIWTAFAKRGMGYSALQGSASSVTDQTAAFDLPPAPNITTQPVDVTVNPGDNASFTVAATPAINGAALYYTWQVSTNGGGTWNDIVPAVTTATLNLTAVTVSMNGYKYRCIIRQGCNTTTSSVATLTVFFPSGFTFTTPAQATSVCPAPATMDIVLGTNVIGGFANPITVSSSPAPAGTTVSFNPSATVTPGNSVTVSLNNTNTLAPGSYTLTITGTATGASTQTRDITYTITPGTGPSITSQPSNQTLCAVGNTSFSITAATATSFQWQVSTDGGTTWVNVTNSGVYTGATTNTLNLTGVTGALNGHRYRAQASALCGSSTSNAAILTVNTAPSITTQPQTIEVCTGSSATFSVVATGSALTYQWQISSNGCGGIWTNIPAATSSSYTLTGITPGQDNTGYRVVISGTCTPAVTSNCALLIVVTTVSITTQPVNQAVCEGSAVTFTTVGTGPGVIYQWQVSTDGGSTWTNVTNGGAYSGATTGSLLINPATFAMNNYRYRAQLSNATCTTPGLTNTAILTVNTLPTITAQPQNATTCVGGSNTFSSTASGTGIIYQWQLSTDGGSTYANINGATGSVYNVTGATAAMNNYRYRLVVTGICSPTAISNAAILTVVTPVAISSNPANAEGCSGGTTTFNVGATSTQTIIYQWQLSTDGGTTWANIPGANAAAYTVSGLATGMNNNRYRVQVSSTSCSAPTISNAVTLTVRQLPSVGLTATPLTSLLPGQTTILTATPSASTGGTLTITWYKDGTLFANTGVSYVADIYTVGSYQVKIQESWPGGLTCFNESQVVVISGTAGSKLFIFPSPNDGQFSVAYYNSSGAGTSRTITVFDSKGSKVFGGKFPISGPYTLIPVDIRPAQQGIYYVVVVDQQGSKIAEGKVMVNW